jgi:ATP-dependent helicase/nuclease subunit A
VTDEAHHRGPSARIRQELTDEPAVPASTGSVDVATLHETSSHGADAGYAWGLLIHGLLEHAMQRKDATRVDLERLAQWLTVEFPELRPHIPKAVDVVTEVSKAEFWRQARDSAECLVEVPFAVRQDDASGLPTVVRGVIDLVFRADDGWKILDYKTDQVADAALLVGRYGGQIEAYTRAWSKVTSRKTMGALYSVRTGHLVDVIQGEEQSLT